MNIFHQFWRKVYWKALYPFNVFLHHLESKNPHKIGSKKNVPVFILGAPRSGSTLLYQVLADTFKFTYLSNLHSLLWGGVSLVEDFFHPCEKKREENFSSSFGNTHGLFSPSECPHFWYRFFRHNPPHVSLKDADPLAMQNLRKVLYSLMSIADRPLLVKNLYCALRLEPLIHYLPEAVFIIIERDIVDNSRSILEARKNNFGNYTTWFSVKPPGYEKLLSLPPHKQVVEQIKAIYQLIDVQLNNFPANRIIRVRYENLCSEPREVIEQMRIFFSKIGIKIDKRHDSLEPFVNFREVSIEPSLNEALCQYVNNEREGNYLSCK
ncbi:sulfotransferase [Candidatus Pacearchaeota archaeon]|nr:sulfotransferase [Candidatus Pacearchaeota archaeon]